MVLDILAQHAAGFFQFAHVEHEQPHALTVYDGHAMPGIIVQEITQGFDVRARVYEYAVLNWYKEWIGPPETISLATKTCHPTALPVILEVNIPGDALGIGRTGLIFHRRK